MTKTLTQKNVRRYKQLISLSIKFKYLKLRSRILFSTKSIFKLLFILTLSYPAQGIPSSIEPELKTLPNETIYLEKIGRWDHSFTFSLGISEGQWDVKIFNERQSTKHSSVLSKLRYGYHLQIYDQFGYVLGSSAGYVFEKQSSQNIESKNSIHLPGLFFGLVQNSYSYRFGIGTDIYLERFLNIIAIEDRQDYKLSVTMNPQFDNMVWLDYFSSQKFGIRAELHHRKIMYNPPRSSTGQLTDANLNKVEWVYMIGFVYLHHLG